MLRQLTAGVAVSHVSSRLLEVMKCPLSGILTEACQSLSKLAFLVFREPNNAVFSHFGRFLKTSRHFPFHCWFLWHIFIRVSMRFCRRLRLFEIKRANV
jgi:hypothetical protein